MNVEKLNKDLVEIALLVTELTAIADGLRARCKDLENDRDHWRDHAMRLREITLKGCAADCVAPARCMGPL